ncbi:hypothetical protein [Stutzerimonas nitrititolerans]|uniref:hypothetical protein n=1 Tax=Stutzerimonas nitrititolerans TaxID=2482751 RepID=UPI0028B03D03|nr:hypothetical protein [Stutzerimonas nitrititolerans]
MFGIEAFDENSVKVLGMEDFTFRKIFEAEIPPLVESSPTDFNSYVRTDTLNFTVPGYSPSKCFVVITPKNYAQSAQNVDGPWGPFTPYYKDLGGEVIGVVRYIQDNWYDISNQRYRGRWRANTPLCALEVYEVF